MSETSVHFRVRETPRATVTPVSRNQSRQKTDHEYFYKLQFKYAKTRKF